MEQFYDVKLEKYVTNLMLEIGMPANLKGYHYLREAVMISGKDKDVSISVTKILYPEVAKKYNTTSQKVERSIRNAIEVTWRKGNRENIERLFGYSKKCGRNRPTNSEYIARMRDMIRLDFLAEMP